MTQPTRRSFMAGALVAAGALSACAPAKPSFKSFDLTGADYALGFDLTDQRGQRRSLADFKGRVVMVFFGFTQCPDFCPTTLSEMVQVKHDLGAQGDKMQAIFITLDPERDTPEMLKAYLGNFDPSFVALVPTAQELEARQNQDLTRRQLELLVNQPVKQIARLNVNDLKLLPPEPANLDEWTRKAEQASPEIKALQARLEAARREVGKAQAGHFPTLDAVAQWSNSGSENITRVNSRYENKTIGLQLNIPIYSGGYVNSTIRQAVAEQTRTEESLEALRRDLGVRVHKEYRGVSEGVMRVRALEQAARSAEQMMKSTQMSQKAGSRTQLDVLNAQQQYTLALRDLAQARLVYLLSKVRLSSLVGDDANASVEQVNGSLSAR